MSPDEIDMDTMEEDDDGMAAMMGFGSFGGPPKAKRRKQDMSHGSDGITDTSRNLGQGADNVPVGARKNNETTSTMHNAFVAKNTVESREAGHASKDIEVDLSSKGRKKAESGLAAFVSRGKALAEPVATVQTPIVDDGAHGGQLARSEQPDHNIAHSTGGVTTKVQDTQTSPPLAAYRNGVKNANGDMVYYLPSFIEDPWAVG